MVHDDDDDDDDDEDDDDDDEDDDDDDEDEDNDSHSSTSRRVEPVKENESQRWRFLPSFHSYFFFHLSISDLVDFPLQIFDLGILARSIDHPLAYSLTHSLTRPPRNAHSRLGTPKLHLFSPL